MRNIAIVPVIVSCWLPGIFVEKAYSQPRLANVILTDSRPDNIQSRPLRLLTGFAAGTSYGERWINKQMVLIQVLLLKGFTNEAWNKLNPIIDRTIEHKGFYEWYDVQNRSTCLMPSRS
jgi:hypothetical protein